MRRATAAIAASIALAGVLTGACSAPEGERAASAESKLVPVVDDDGRVVLPNWATDEEVARGRTAPDARNESSPPPAKGFRVPAEYEPVASVVMTWAGHASVLRGIAVATAAAGADVWMVGGPPSIAGVAPARYRVLPYGYDSIWSRDYGPVGIDEATGTLGIVDTTYRHHAVRLEDDAMSCNLAKTIGAACHGTSLILDGGNYMTDGRGNVFVTRRVYDWNASLSRAAVDALLRQYLHAETVHVLDYAIGPTGSPADGTGHIDMFAKLVADCKVLVAETEVEPYRTVTEKAAAYFANLTCAAGAPGARYAVTRVKGWTRGRTWYTYTNSLLVNRTAIIPFYEGSAAANADAAATYRDVLPDYSVVGVMSESTIVQGGSIHCITKEIPLVTPTR